jgi:hypothetical protein
MATVPCSAGRAALTPLAGSLRRLQVCKVWPRATALTSFAELTSLTALSMTLELRELHPAGWAAVACLTGLRRLELSTEEVFDMPPGAGEVLCSLHSGPFCSHATRMLRQLSLMSSGVYRRRAGRDARAAGGTDRSSYGRSSGGQSCSESGPPHPVVAALQPCCAACHCAGEPLCGGWHCGCVRHATRIVRSL